MENVDVLRHFNEPAMSLSGKSVFITGGTGSFGTSFVRRLLVHDTPQRIVVFSRDEQKQETLERDLRKSFPQNANRMRYFIGDVRDTDRLDLAMRGIDYVIHAAALKIIPTAEYNPFECIQTNVHGAENVVKAALRNNVSKVLALSTDKAANPINLYGASKLAADKIMVAANNLSGDTGTSFAVVRYGNVIGSRGSVVPLFRRMVSEGAKTLPITDPRMTRFWITLDQGVSFVLSSLSLMQGGEIFIPKIPSMKITDIAKAVAPNLPVEVVGIRPGEKLHEVMINEDDARATLDLPDRYVIAPPIPGWEAHHLTKAGGKPVPEGFRYASDSNDEWMDADGMNALMATKPA